MSQKPLLFDMDGLLLDTERVAMQAFRDCAVPVGLAPEAADAAFLGLVGVSGPKTRERLVHILPNGTDIEGFRQAWLGRFHDHIADGIPLRPHVGQVIVALSQAGHDMAVVTSTMGAHAREQLDRAGLLTHFRRVIGGDEVSANKPDPAPYLAGAAALGAPPADCFAFEDSDTGVASAIAAGCRVFQIPDLRPADKPVPALGQTLAADLADAVRRAGLNAG